MNRLHALGSDLAGDDGSFRATLGAYLGMSDDVAADAKLVCEQRHRGRVPVKPPPTHLNCDSGLMPPARYATRSSFVKRFVDGSAMDILTICVRAPRCDCRLGGQRLLCGRRMP